MTIDPSGLPWADVHAAAPDLADAVAGRFAANLHHVLGTVGPDGGPRLWGLEVPIRAGQLWLGMMPASLKARDLRADPRFALHSAPLEEDLASGDAKIDGRAVEVSDDPAMVAAFIEGTDSDIGELPGGLGLFRALVTRLVLTTVADDHLVIRSWTPEAGEARRTVM